MTSHLKPMYGYVTESKAHAHKCWIRWLTVSSHGQGEVTDAKQLRLATANRKTHNN